MNNPAEKPQNSPSPAPRASRRSLPLHVKIFIGLFLGIVAGLTVNYLWGPDHVKVKWLIDHITDPIGNLFLRLLLLLVIPLVFSSLISGIAGMGDIRTLGRVGLKCFLYTLVISGISVVIGLTLSNLIQPGKRISPETAQGLKDRYSGQAKEKISQVEDPKKSIPPLKMVIDTVIPTNLFTSLTGTAPNMLHVMFFAVLLGVGMTLLPSETAEPFLKFCQSLFEGCAVLISLVMKLAPYSVACLLFNNMAQFGVDLLGALFWYLLTVLLGLGLHMFGVYSFSVSLLSRISPWEFFRRIRVAMLTAFSTSSSNATLPTAMRVTEQELGVPPDISRFVLTVGATANQNGTALYEGVTILFLCQLGGVDLTLPQQLMVAYLAILGGIGTAGVPSGSIPFIAVVLTNLNPGLAPLIAIILGVDRILDMCRTTLNVTGDITIATYVARSEGYPLLDPPK